MAFEGINQFIDKQIERYTAAKAIGNQMPIAYALMDFDFYVLSNSKFKFQRAYLKQVWYEVDPALAEVHYKTSKKPIKHKS